MSRFSRTEIENAICAATSRKQKQSDRDLYRENRCRELARAGKSLNQVLWIVYGLVDPSSDSYRAMEQDHNNRISTPFYDPGVATPFQAYQMKKQKLEANVRRIIKEESNG